MTKNNMLWLQFLQDLGNGRLYAADFIRAGNILPAYEADVIISKGIGKAVKNEAF